MLKHKRNETVPLHYNFPLRLSDLRCLIILPPPPPHLIVLHHFSQPLAKHAAGHFIIPNRSHYAFWCKELVPPSLDCVCVSLTIKDRIKDLLQWFWQHPGQGSMSLNVYALQVRLLSEVQCLVDRRENRNGFLWISRNDPWKFLWVNIHRFCPDSTQNLQLISKHSNCFRKHFGQHSCTIDFLCVAFCEPSFD